MPHSPEIQLLRETGVPGGMGRKLGFWCRGHVSAELFKAAVYRRWVPGDGQEPDVDEVRHAWWHRAGWHSSQCVEVEAGAGGAFAVTVCLFRRSRRAWCA